MNKFFILAWWMLVFATVARAETYDVITPDDEDDAALFKNFLSNYAVVDRRVEAALADGVLALDFSQLKPDEDYALRVARQERAFRLLDDVLDMIRQTIRPLPTDFLTKDERSDWSAALIAANRAKSRLVEDYKALFQLAQLSHWKIGGPDAKFPADSGHGFSFTEPSALKSYLGCREVVAFHRALVQEANARLESLVAAAKARADEIQAATAAAIELHPDIFGVTGLDFDALPALENVVRPLYGQLRAMKKLESPLSQSFERLIDLQKIQSPQDLARLRTLAREQQANCDQLQQKTNSLFADFEAELTRQNYAGRAELVRRLRGEPNIEGFVSSMSRGSPAISRMAALLVRFADLAEPRFGQWTAVSAAEGRRLTPPRRFRFNDPSADGQYREILQALGSGTQDR